MGEDRHPGETDVNSAVHMYGTTVAQSTVLDNTKRLQFVNNSIGRWRFWGEADAIWNWLGGAVGGGKSGHDFW